LLDEFELELLDHASELVFVDVLLDVFVLAFPASTALVPARRRKAAPIAIGVVRLRRLMTSSARYSSRILAGAA
jgi:hypothetical protein